MARSKRTEIFWLHPHILFWNGGTRYVFEVTKRLAKRYKVNLLVSKTNVKSTKEFEAVGVNVIEINSSSTYNPLYWLTLPFQLAKESANLRALIAESPSCTLVASMLPTNIVAYMANKEFTQICWEPYAFFYDDDLVNDLPLIKSYFARSMKLIYQKLDKRSVLGAKNLLTLNKATGRWVEKIYSRKPSLNTYMGVDSKHFNPVNNSKLSIKYKNKKIIFHSTDYTELKGTKWALKALPKIVKQVPETLLLISSPHSDSKKEAEVYRQARELGIQENVECLGNIAYSKLPDYYTLADLILFTGIGDHGAGAAASLSVLEGLACKTPVVRSNYTKEEVEEGKSGYLINPKKPAEIARACIKILLNSTKAKAMGDYGRQRVLKLYNWDNTVTVIEGAIQHE